MALPAVEGGELDAGFTGWIMGFPRSWDEVSPRFSDWKAVQEILDGNG